MSERVASPQDRESELADVKRRLDDIDSSLDRLRVTLEGRPSTYVTFLTTLSAPGYRLNAPVPVTIEIEGDEVSATWLQTDAIGYGGTPSQAIAALETELVAMFDEFVRCDEEQLGPEPRRWRRLLQATISSAAS